MSSPDERERETERETERERDRERQRKRNGVNIFFSVVIVSVIKNICTKLHEKILNGSQEMRNIHQNNGPKNTQTCPIAEKYLLLIVTTHKKIIAWHSLLGVILGYFGAHFDVCSNKT